MHLIIDVTSRMQNDFYLLKFYNIFFLTNHIDDLII